MKTIVEVGAWETDRDAISLVHHKYKDNEYHTTVSVRHVTTPFKATIKEPSGEAFDLDSTPFSEIGQKYVEALDSILKEELGIPASWLASLSDESGNFGWLSWNARDVIHDGKSAASFVFERQDKQSEVQEKTLVLYATYTDAPSSSKIPFEWGIRIVFHMLVSNTGPQYAHITSSSFSLPLDLDSEVGFISTGIGSFLSQYYGSSESTFYSSIGGLAVSSIGFSGSEDEHVPHGLTYAKGGDNKGILEVRRRDVEPSNKGNKFDDIPVEIVTGIRLANENDTDELQKPVYTKKIRLITHAQDNVFDLDPNSIVKHGALSDDRKRGPSATEAQLKIYMSGKTRATESLAEAGQFKVMESLLVDGESPDRTKEVPLQSRHQTFAVRSNEQSALSAYHHFKSFFEKMDSYGIDHTKYFRHINLPLEVHYRATMIGGPASDGQTVNAQVHPSPVSDNQTRPSLQIRFAQGTLQHRSREKWNDHTRPREHAEPMGLSLDPRWFWHEIGHVLIMGSVGELELRFAHSMGDALSAIVLDPYALESDIADARRGLTFPWVHIPRRHDREATDGWSWDGTFGKAAKAIPFGNRVSMKGYDTEQILSSSLFRLYLIAGGCENTNNIDSQGAREFASHYVTYLIIKATNLLGDARISPANHPDQFVSALIDADVSTSLFSGDLSGNPSAENDRDSAIKALEINRTGGTLHKVIRWVFEVQGLYASNSDVVNDCPGAPPVVDVYISDKRQQIQNINGYEVNYGPGNYSAVSAALEFDERGDLFSDVPWLAADDAIAFNRKAGEFTVKVGNRGLEKASSVVVTIWVTELSGNIRSLPEWIADEASPQCWTKLAVSNTFDVPAGSTVSVTPEVKNTASLDLENGSCLILCEASCLSDRSNIDPKASLPCSRKADLYQLVSGDNNLGVTIHNPGGVSSTSTLT